MYKSAKGAADFKPQTLSPWASMMNADHYRALVPVLNSYSESFIY